MSMVDGRSRARGSWFVVSGLALFLGACGAIKLSVGGGSGDPPGTEASDTETPGAARGGTAAADGQVTSNVEGPPSTSLARVDLPPLCVVRLGSLKFASAGDAASMRFEGNGKGDCKWNGVSAYDCKWSYPASDLGPADSGLLQLWPLDGGFNARWGSGASYSNSEYCGVHGETGTTVSASPLKGVGESCSTAAHDCQKELRCLEQKSGAASTGTKCVAAAGTKCGASSDCNSDSLSCSSYVCK